MQRFLVAISSDGPHDRLAAEVRALAQDGDAHFHIVVPAISRGGAESAGERRARAENLLDSITSALDDVPNVDGSVADANLLGAIGGELDRHSYEVLAIVTPPIRAHERERLVDLLVRLYR